MKSLRFKLSVAIIFVLIVFVVLTGFLAQHIIRQRAINAQHNMLQGLVYSIMGNSNITPTGEFRLPTAKLYKLDLTLPGSGVYVMVLGAAGQIVWQSPSLTQRILIARPPGIGEWVYGTTTTRHSQSLMTAAFGMRWIAGTGENYRFTVVAARDMAPLAAQLHHSRNKLLLVLGCAALLILLVQIAVMTWGMRPMRRVVDNLHAIEQGDKARIEGNYPSELEPLISRLNALLASEQKRLTRYRNALGDLAHSLKGPLTILRGLDASHALPDDYRRQRDEQLGRINEIVDYQLQRAAAAGTRTLAPPVVLKPVAQKITRSLAKVYHDRQIAFVTDIPERMELPMDEGDITEILGNLLDNAAKYGAGRVRISARRRGHAVQLLIEDNGAGFPADKQNSLLERGVRADTRREGQGIGLALTAEIIHAYDGTIELASRAGGGAQVKLVLPAG